MPLILSLIKGLADYERLSDRMVATEADLRETLFGPRRSAEVIIAYAGSEPAGFAVWFHSYSTFLGRPGLYLEDLFVRPEWRGKGIGRRLLASLRAPRSIADAAVSSGRCSIGTSRRSAFTGRWARSRWTSGRRSG